VPVESPQISSAQLRTAITAAYRMPEADCMAGLLAAAALPQATTQQAHDLACRLITALRAKGGSGPVTALIREYDLSSPEGIALMCLAEALLRIPDPATRDALIQEKIAPGDWRAHFGQDRPLFVNAATWGLVVTGRLTAAGDDHGLAAALTRLLARGGAPMIRGAVDLAMRMMGEQFVTGQTIAQALSNSRRLQARGFRYSYDMLGEAAATAADAAAYATAYEAAIHAIGAAAAGLGIYEGPGISIKLSALHPRYCRAQKDRVMAELAPRLLALAELACVYDIGLNIDAEEADRLDLSLDLLETLCFAPSLSGWNGLGFVVQAYQKRAVPVLDWIIDLARRSHRRLMIRLVKGAYWDSEIKRAQAAGLDGFPVFTRKPHTDVSYIACARRMLAAPDAVFAQFATHNAQTLATIHAMAGPCPPDAYEFQCLHGMGEALYEHVVGPANLGRACRIYAPVGTHETLLAYLVRRLLENGANSSFVNRIADPAVPIAELARDPVAQVASLSPIGAGHPRIALPRDLYGPTRRNAAGPDLSDESVLADLDSGLQALATRQWTATATAAAAPTIPVRNPADRADIVGHAAWATQAEIDAAFAQAAQENASTAPARAACLTRAADLMEARQPELLSLLIREAGKTLPNAAAELREAVDFLRYYAAQAAALPPAAAPLGPVVCISPWNFPLAIFTGQVAAALAAGNNVLAKPAEETPLTAAAATAILHESGIPAAALHLLPGDGAVGAALVADPRGRAVLFTGSTEVARLIQRQLAQRLNPDGAPVPLIAETGGQNAMIVDSSALPEQVVADVLASAFDSAGQRCSGLRILCLPQATACRILGMLHGALAELDIGNPARLACDIGPLISPAAAAAIETHITAMRTAGHPIHRPDLPPACAAGSFAAPAIIEIFDLATLGFEVFGPVLHVLRYRRDDMDNLVDRINALGYGLTFGVHSRLETVIARLTTRLSAGNIYVNRNMVGAVVGVQPFGGHGLSGTGPKAGGPLYLPRLLADYPAPADLKPGQSHDLPGPVGERNIYRLEPRGTVLCIAATPAALSRQVVLATATGNQILSAPVLIETAAFDAVLFDGTAADLLELQSRLASRRGPVIGITTARADGSYPVAPLLRECSISINTAAAGGNAALLMLDEPPAG
jgi:RHH-type proline utilization regulon transcriptional repressor/proline dehydrogenase/delta 1-pyrroline-5-carboxylate dehydrogenase